MTRHQSELDKRRAAVIVYGSMQYDDPKNFDLDLLIYSPAKDKWLAKQAFFGWTDEMYQVWEERLHSRAGAQVSYSDPDLLRRHCKNVGKERYVTDHCVDMEVDWANASVILSGQPVYEASPGTLAEARAYVLELCRDYSLMAAAVLVEVEDCVETRSYRR